MVQVVILPVHLAGVSIDKIVGQEGFLTCPMEPELAEEFCKQMELLRARELKRREVSGEMADLIYALTQGITPTPAQSVLLYQKAAELFGLEKLD